MPPKSVPFTQAAIRRMIKDNVNAAIVAERARKVNVRNKSSGSGPARGQDAVPTAREYTFARMVEPKKAKVDAYIRGLTDNIKGEVTSSRPANLNEPVRMAHKLMDQKAQARDKRILEGKKRKWESFQNGNSSGKGNQRNNSRFLCVNDFLLAMLVSVRSSVGRLVTSQGIVRRKMLPRVQMLCLFQLVMIVDAELKCPNVVTGTILLNNRYAFVLFDSGSDRRFVDTRFSSMLDIDQVKIGASYEVELVDGRVKERSESGRAFKMEIVVARAIKGITHVKLCIITKGKEMRELWLPSLLIEGFLCVNDFLLAMLVSVRSSVGRLAGLEEVTSPLMLSVNPRM
uniref:Reverse transcriptase domain-containing protein n=1 Tax=Tanacetum cinerariifolium TaxID=118510 RepID=A0A6L2JMT8_TANCI|nr:reverse transcriptase domain-containing protein [Tanacetum cinerariifolium]